MRLTLVRKLMQVQLENPQSKNFLRAWQLPFHIFHEITRFMDKALTSARMSLKKGTETTHSAIQHPTHATRAM